MKTPFTMRLRPQWRPRRPCGFTMVELMIAMLLGLIVIAGVGSVFLANQRSYRTNTALADVETSSRIAYELMARDIRQAGLTGCNSANGRIVNVLKNANNGNNTWWAMWSNAVRGYDDATNDPALPASASSASGSIQLIGASGAPLSINYDNPGVNFKLNQPTDTLQEGDVIMVCSPDHAALLQISGYNNTNVTVDYNTGSPVTPGNCSSNLGYPNVNCAGNSPQYKFPPNSQISKFEAIDWYIGTNPVGGTSLYRATLVNSGGTMTVKNTEMVRNVTGMTISYLAPSANGIGNAFQTATTIQADDDWDAVTAVRVQLTMQSNFQHASANGRAPIQRSYSFTTALRNRLK